ncbi:MAG: DEAD/DEAH box helicase [Spirochaetaceae bacterium]|jgi:DEAD/DEAH box helicase domain-containing protein|nr:DEAD/DEAH box helicase [Spirochaetaceae bacterium]
MSSSHVIDAIIESDDFAPYVVCDRTLRAVPARFVPFPAGLHEGLAEALRRRGIDRVYTHQAEVYDHVMAGRNAVVVTPTASGKTLCYNLPVLHTLLGDPGARALYLFPTKALSQDQQSELNELITGRTQGGEFGEERSGSHEDSGAAEFALDAGALRGCPPLRGVAEDRRSGARGEASPRMNALTHLRIATYDGDTPGSVRTQARDRGRIIISNPDMLHTGILPNHTKWITFFSHLRFVVIDEAHAYRGVFGSHVANVVRRLKRIARFYGARPVFILSSATIGNPKELAEMLTGERVELVDNNGAPRGEKRVVLYNPPLVDKVQGIRVSSLNESRRWMLALLRAGVKTILFAHSRIKTEVAASYVNEDVKNINTDNGRIRVEAYRGGLLPNERREIEKGLRDGSIQGVVSTNALELGIDIGGLDASIVAGFPGSFNSFWQQSGRAGRRGGTSVSVFIASAAALDQFLIHDPEWFFRKAAEEARLDADNPYILSDHVKCAAFELPFREKRLLAEGATNGEVAEAADVAGTRDGERAAGTVIKERDPFGAGAADVLGFLEVDGVVRKVGGRPDGDCVWHWADRSYPAEGVSLRSAATDNVVIIDVTKGRNAVIGEMDRPSAKEMLFKNAVYIHRGEQFIVQELDIENRKALVLASDVNYFTDGLVKTDIQVLSEDVRGECNRAGQEVGAAHEIAAQSIAAQSIAYTFSLGDALVRSQVTKYKKLRFHTHENLGFGVIDLPEEEMQTRALALLFPAESSGGRALKPFTESDKGAALRGLGMMVRQIAGVFLLCDRADLGIAERVRDPHFEAPALYIYDKYPGGTGLAEALAGRTAALFAALNEAIAACPCRNGCPSCVGPGGEKAKTQVLLKAIVDER